MAIARKCDRCGKLYEYYPQGNRVRYNGVQRIYKHIDFCPECMSAFDEFMIRGKFVEAKHE